MSGADRRHRLLCPTCPYRSDIRADAAEPLAVWSGDAMRAACARRDVAAVYRLLQRHGVTQDDIAGAVGQTQSEVSEITTTTRAKTRRVISVEVLERIADGLGTPRSWWGLAHDDDSALLRGR